MESFVETLNPWAWNRSRNISLASLTRCGYSGMRPSSSRTELVRRELTEISLIMLGVGLGLAFIWMIVVARWTKTIVQFTMGWSLFGILVTSTFALVFSSKMASGHEFRFW